MSARRPSRRLAPVVAAAVLAGSVTAVLGGPGTAQATTVSWATLEQVLSRATSTLTSPPTATPSDNVPDGPLMGNGHLTAVVGGTADAQTYYVGATDFWQDKAPRTIGGLKLSIPSLASPTSYKLEQDVAHAEVRSTFATSTRSVTAKAWVSATSDLMVVTLTNATTSAATPVTVTTFTGASAALPTTAGVTSGTLWATRTTNGSVWNANAALATRVLGATPTTSTNGTSTASGTFTLAAGQTVRVVTVLGDSGGSVSGSPWPAPTAPATLLTNARTRVGQLNTTSGSTNSVLDPDALHTAHLNWWKAFWTGGANIDLGGGAMERYWYTSLYALASANRSGLSAPSMTMFLTNDTPVWGGNWTNDYNFEMPYQGLYAAGHVELTQPYERGVQDCLAQSVSIAAAAGFSGALYGNNMMVGGQGCDFETDLMKGNAAWLATNFVHHWLVTRDTAWATSTGYPYLLQVANFWDADLRKDTSGRYTVVNSAQNEWSSYQFNPIGDLAWLRLMYPALLDMSQTLGLDSARRAKWQDIIANLSAYPTFISFGHKDFKATEDAPGFYGGDANPVNGVWPGSTVDLGSDPDLVLTARNTMYDLDVWCQGNSFGWIFPAAARVGYDQTYAKLDSYLSGGCTNGQVGLRGNSTVAQWGGGAETFGGMETVTSMLMTSVTALRLFPTWPKTRNASFQNLLADGAFEVTSSLASGVVGATTVTSRKGGTLKVASPWAAGTVAVTDRTAGTAVTLTPSAGNVVSFATVAGHDYVLTGTGSYDYSTGIPATTSPVNLARGSTVSAFSSHEGDGWSGAALVDGNEAGTAAPYGWSSGDAGTGADHTEWVQVDLGSATTLGRVDLTPRLDGGNAGYGFPVDLTVATSTDGSTWTTALTRTGLALPTGTQSYSFPAVQARYLRVSGTALRANPNDGNQYRMQFAELKAYWPADTSFGDTVTASSSHEGDGWARSQATDHKPGGWSSGDTGTGTDHAEWVQLDHGSARTVGEVDLYPRSDGSNAGQGFPAALTIAVSTDGSTWTTVATGSTTAPPAGVQAYTFPVTSARYVRVTGTSLRANPNDGNQYRMQFAEVSVR